jgi:lipoate-protein ligase A
MKCLDLTLPTPAENLACDEALLDWCEEDGGGEILRFWEPTDCFIVVGYANRVGAEVDLAACAANGIPVLRRCSGGGTVLQGPGCLNYSLVLRFGEHPTSNLQPPTSNEVNGSRLTPDPAHLALQSIPSANRFIMERNRATLAQVVTPHASRLTPHDIAVRGHTDLALGGLKFSGNSQRRRKRFLLFHGTFLLDFDLGAVGRYLRMPSQQPEYRRNRSHADFLTNLGLPAGSVKSALQTAWRAEEPDAQFPRERIPPLARGKYSAREWNFKFE